MTKIAKSLAMIAFVAAIAIGTTSSLFSDVETSENNTFTAGTIDIDIDGHNPFVDSFDIGDLKPGEVGYINFRINNVGANPVDVSKKLYNFTHTDSGEDYDCAGLTPARNGKTSSEPECVAEQANSNTRVDNVETQILYDLSVEVYDSGNNKVWWQTIYAVDGTDDKSLEDVYGTTGNYNYVALGMIPVNGYMEVTQSYHFNSSARNEYQGDGLEFDMEILGKQLTGANGMATVTLENKGGAPDWNLILNDDFTGTLEYETNGPEFVYAVSGKAELISHKYVLAIGLNGDTNVDTFVTDVITDNNGDFSVSGSVELGADMMGVKAWLIPYEYWNNGSTGSGAVTGWGQMDKWLWETSYLWYNDTDI